VNLSRYFERATRGRENGPDQEGSTFVRLTDDAPEWLTDAVREAHDGELPDDWRYETCELIASMLDERPEWLESDDDSDLAHEIADSLTDVYNFDRLTWLAGSLIRPDYVNDAVREYGIPTDGFDLVEAIGWGQYSCLRQMAEILITAVREVSCDD
jgi:hypothetical protein